MPCWYFDKVDLKKTPSLQDGVPPETEARYRREGTRYIFDMGAKLGLSHDTHATAVVFFHRFYIFHSFKKFPRYITATCCLFLAGKVEETPKKCKDLVKVARSLLSDAHFTQFGEDPREEVMTFERILLQTIKFDLQVEHPYKYLVQYAKALKGDKAKVEHLVQMAWTFINDSFSTSLCLQWEPQIVAVAVMYLAGRLCKFEPQDWAYNRGRWWEQFIDDISMDLLEDICHQVLDLYSHQKPKSVSKAKRERPKTPGDVDKSNEPQAKAMRQDSKHAKNSENHHKAKPSSSTSSNKVQGSNQQQIQPIKRQTSSQSTNSTGNVEVSRQDSTNTEEVAMDTVETCDSGTIETHSAHLPAQEPSGIPSKATDYYSSVNEYQSFMTSDNMSSMALSQQKQLKQYSYSNNSVFQQPHVYSSVPTTPQTPTAPQHRPSFTGPPPPPPQPPFPTSFPQPSFDVMPPTGFPPRFPSNLPPTYSGNQDIFYPDAHPPMGMATVRITVFLYGSGS
uniref:cyclin-K-like n=1 Tax=Styela clava TaxID=7725 RepID=UPI00193AD755|nr:cyclin-K-like [Styela clava]